MPLRLRSLVLVCMALLGFQFCMPLVVQAADASHAAEVITVGTKDPESKPGLHVDLDAPVSFIVVLLALPVSGTPELAFAAEDDREALTLLPATGLQPSAP